MTRTGEMNEDGVLQTVRASVGRARRPTRPSLTAVMTRGRSRRHRRRASYGLAGLAAAIAAAVSLAGVTGAGRPASPSAAAPAARLAAFSVTSNRDGTTTLTVSAIRHLDPGALRRALAAHGIPALVTDGSFCTSAPALAGLAQAVRIAPAAHLGVIRHASIVINGRAIPAGAELSIGYTDGALQEFSATLIDKAARSCTTAWPVTGPASVLTIAWVSP